MMTATRPFRELLTAAFVLAIGIAAGEILGRFLLRGMPPAAMIALRVGSAPPGIGMAVVPLVRGRRPSVSWCLRMAFAAATMGAYWLVGVYCLSSGDPDAHLPVAVVFRVWCPGGAVMGLLTVALIRVP